MSKDKTTNWQHIDSLPSSCHVLLALYQPTNWAYYVSSRRLNADDPPRARELAIRYARAWMPAPEEPPEEFLYE